jgi:hypothetical protein
MSSNIDRKEIIREYKARATPRGVFAMRCLATGEVWVGSSMNLDGARNRILFSLGTGHYKDAALQARWNAHGEQAFQYEVLEKLDDDVSALRVGDVLKERSSHWLAQLRARPL